MESTSIKIIKIKNNKIITVKHRERDIRIFVYKHQFFYLVKHINNAFKVDVIAQNLVDYNNMVWVEEDYTRQSVFKDICPEKNEAISFNGMIQFRKRARLKKLLTEDDLMTLKWLIDDLINPMEMMADLLKSKKKVTIAVVNILLVGMIIGALIF